MGDIKIAKELILLAKEAGVDVAKFQTRDNKLLLTNEQYNVPHPNPSNSYGKTYEEHREFLELSNEEIIDLKSFCELNDKKMILGIIILNKSGGQGAVRELINLIITRII